MLQKIRASTQMYPELYQKWFKLSLNPTEMVLIEILMKVIGLLSKATLGQIADRINDRILVSERANSVSNRPN